MDCEGVCGGYRPRAHPVPEPCRAGDAPGARARGLRYAVGADNPGARVLAATGAGGPGAGGARPGPGPRVSVVVPVLDQWQDLERCLEWIRARQPLSDVEIVVVDNGSREPPPERLRERCTVVLSCARGGSYAARNRGVAAARGAILVFTDADCVPDPGWLQAGLERMDEDDAPDIVAGRIAVFADGEAPTDVERYDMAWGLRQRNFVRRGFGATANLFVRREALERHGPFRDDLYSGGDREWCRRAVRGGARIAYGERALVWHPARRDFGELRRKTRRLAGGRWHEHGRGWRRMVTFLGLMLPPLSPIGAALAPTRRALRDRLAFLRVSAFIWRVRVAEIARLIAGGAAEHR